MSTKKLPTDLFIRSFSSISEFESFLEREHATSPGIHLKLARKSCKTPSVTSAEALEVALCYGWINGQGNSFDEDWYLARYTPRRSKSTWSKINVDLVKKLSDEGRMRPPGISAVEAAKADGRWDRAYAGPSTITVPDDLSASLANEPTAAAFFEGLNKTDRYYVLLQIELASPKNRANRIRSSIQMLAAGKRPGASSKPKTKKSETSKPQGITKNVTSKGSALDRKKSSSQHTEVKDEPSRQSRRPGLRNRS